MTRAATQPQESSWKGKGRAYFEHAEKASEMANYDYAIEMYVEGIRREPDNVERGHQPLREVSLKRKAKGGKPAGMVEQIKRRPGKDPLTNLVNAAYLLAKDPGSVGHMEQVLKAAEAMDPPIPGVVKWIAEIMLEAQRQAKKPDRRVLLMITHAFDGLEEYAKASQACGLILEQNPTDGQASNLFRDISAKYTIQKGKYDQEGDFTKGVADLDKQKELMQKDSLVQDEKYLKHQIEEARREYLESPSVPGKINALVDALLKFEDEAYENEAIDVLSKAHKASNTYAFKMRIGDIRMRQMTRRYRQLMQAGDKHAAAEHAKRQLAFELDEFTERAANYPTDLSLKYELGRRLFAAGRLDEAIAALQQAQRDPRRALRARTLIGQAFTTKGMYPEAARTFERALQGELTEDRAKELRYLYGNVLEKMGEIEKAYEQFSQVAETDYGYKDVRQRLDDLRKKLDEKEAGGAP